MTAAAAGPRLLRVRCTRWDQVESFLRKKLRADGRLSMRVPFDATPGAPVKLTLELPNQIVIALEGAVAEAMAHERTDATVVQLNGARYAMERLEAMLADARAGGEGGSLATMLSAREAELRKLRQQAAHDVLGVSRTPTLEELRRAWRQRARREHPDAVARFGSAALRLTAEEAMIHVTRAYERLRDTVCADKRAVIAGTSVRTVGSLALEVSPSDAFAVEALTPEVAGEIEVRNEPAPPPRRITAPMRAASPPGSSGTRPPAARTATPAGARPATDAPPRRTTAPMPAVSRAPTTPPLAPPPEPAGPPPAPPLPAGPEPAAPPPRRVTAPMRAAAPPPPVELPQLLDNDGDTLDGLDRPISQPLALDLDLPPAATPRVARQTSPSIRAPSAPGFPRTTVPGTAASRPPAASQPGTSPPPARSPSASQSHARSPSATQPPARSPSASQLSDRASAMELPPPLPPPPAAPRATAITAPPASARATGLTAPPASTPAGPTTVEQSLRQARSGPGDRFVRAVHDRLAAGDHAGAVQVATAAHHVYPTDVRLRALIDVAAALAACTRGDRDGAIAALENAIIADPENAEARGALIAVTGAHAVEPSMVQDRFR